MTPEDYDVLFWNVLDAYDEIVTFNRDPEGWDTFLAVLADRDGMVCYEIAESAAQAGIEVPDDEDERWDLWNDVRMAYRSVLRERLIAPHRVRPHECILVGHWIGGEVGRVDPDGTSWHDGNQGYQSCQKA